MPRPLTARAWLSTARAKSPADSQGFISSLLTTGALGILALILTRATGVDIQADELQHIGDQANLLTAQVSAWIGFGAAILALWGNYTRTLRIAFTGPDGKRPWRSRGILGNLTAAIAAIVALTQAIALDADTLATLFHDIRDQWQLTAPPAAALLLALQGIWGRYRATQALRAIPIDFDDFDGDSDAPLAHLRAVILIAVAALTLQTSCTTLDTVGGKLNGLRVQVGVIGAGGALEVTGPQGRGIGAALSFYPVTPEFRRLQVEW